MRKHALLFVLPLVTAFAFGQDTLDLTFRPKANETRKYESKLNLEAMGHKVDISVKQTNKVVEVAANGDYKQETSVTEQKMLMDGEDQDQPISPQSWHRRSAKGDLLELQQPFENPLSQCISFIRFPILADTAVKVGDKWTREFKKDDKLGVNPCTIKYEVTGKDKVGTADVAKVKFTYENDDKGTASGEIWIRISDGTTVKLDGKIDSVSQGQFPVSGTVKMDLV